MQSRADWLVEQIDKMLKEIDHLKGYVAYLLDELAKEDEEEFTEFIIEKEMRLKK